MKLEKAYITQLAIQYKGLLKAEDLINAGLSYKQIRQLTNAGALEKLGRAMYHIPTFSYDERVELTRRIPNGVFCLYSACFIHQLSDFVPSEQHFAIPKKKRFALPKYPPVKLYYWETSNFQLGITTVDINEGIIRVYDIEKTVCDMLRLRLKTGEIATEIIKNYLLRPNRNIAKLHEYARQLRVEKTLNNYLNILL
jgi:predicted transcriptional regulator of viral defense system